MSKLEQLIDELCPEGVEFKTLGELGSFYGGLNGKSKEDFTEGNAKFITYKNIFANLSLKLDVNDTVKIGENEKQNTVQYGDVLFTGSSETPNECGMASVLTTNTDEKLYLNSFCFGFRFFDAQLLLPDFSKYVFRSTEVRKQIGKTASGVTRFNVSKKKMEKVQIPLPPVAVQEEIVRILDSLSELTTELTAELAAEINALKQQYEYYRDELFGKDYDEMINRCFQNNVNVITLEKLGSFTRGKRFVRDDIRDEGTPCIHYGDLYTYYGTSAEKTKCFLDEKFSEKMRFAHKGDVVIVQAGENDMDIGIGVAWMGDEDVAVHDACYIFKHSINPKYISHYLRTSIYHLQIKRYVSTGKICSISAKSIGKAKIPIPPLSEQQRIVEILDHFDALCNDISKGLQAEIKARQQQYKYYRDKLLTFKEKEVFADE